MKSYNNHEITEFMEDDDSEDISKEDVIFKGDEA